MAKIHKIAVVGLGYVGLPLALLAETKGFEVIGVEVNPSKLESLKKRLPIIDDIIANKQLAKTKITFTNDFKEIEDVDAAIICVPTPVDKNKMPDLKLVENAVRQTVKHLKKNALLVVESTINPGVCDDLIIPLIEKETSLIIGQTIHLAHCPERINPGDSKWHVGNINRVIGASSDKGLDLAYNFYSRLIDAKIKKMGSLKEAEAVKIVENSFRDVNIAFVNELAMSFSKLGINVNNVIDGAATKPFAFMAHYPGIGVGGHCIPVDPYYLIEYARSNGFNHKFLSLARSINEGMPAYAIKRLEQALPKKSPTKLNKTKVVVLGLSYKANVADDRESPAYRVIDQFKKKQAVVTTFDPYLLDKSSAKNLQEALAGQEAIVLVTGHKEFLKIDPKKYPKLKVFVDGRNALGHKRAEFTKAGVVYISLGG